MIKIYDINKISLEEILSRGTVSSGVEDIVADILKDVKANGDAALYKYSEKFDKVKHSPLEVTKEEVVNALDAIVDPISLYEPVFSENGDSIYVMDQISDTKNTDESWLTKIAISEAIKTLSERERNIIELRFFEGKTQMEVAKEINISQAQVSRLEKGALLRIRKQI